tara:strand:- start:14 stop:373 length:360 start_codon:yes stop_codon:yes gene_type:complete
MEFCPECENMLYLKIVNDESNQGLIKYCKKCNFTKEVSSTKDSIYSIDYNYDEIKKQNLINEYTVFDPTLPKATGLKCPNVDCKEKPTNIVYLNYDKDDMKFIYICIHCHNAKRQPYIW